VQREISAIFGGNKVLAVETKRSVTPYGGMVVLAEYLKKVEFEKKVKEAMPITLKSPNSIDPAETFTAFLVSVLAGARRFAQSGILRADKGLHALMGIKRFPTDDTIRNFFKRFSQGKVNDFYLAMCEWQMERLNRREEGYSLDLDSTVFERYGKQEGSMKGHNPRKHGRPSHHPILAVLNEARFILHGWLRSGNCSSSRGVEEFLKEALYRLGKEIKIRVVRCDSGFFDQKLLEFLEEKGLSYIVVAKMTRWLKTAAKGVKEWRSLDNTYSVGEFNLKLYGWSKERRFVAIREKITEKKDAVGRRLIDVPGYTFRIFVTNKKESAEEIWRDYNKRAEIENRIGELKTDLAADDFCMKQFYATEAAFMGILLLFNLLSELQKMSDMKKYRRPGTLRSHLFLCGAILGKEARQKVLRLSQDWGGLSQRNSLMDKILEYVFPTSPKLAQTG
jgi:Transposase DDE domain group 1